MDTSWILTGELGGVPSPLTPSLQDVTGSKAILPELQSERAGCSPGLEGYKMFPVVRPHLSNSN